MNSAIPHQISRRKVLGAGALGAAFIALGAGAATVPAAAAENGNLPVIGADYANAFVFWGPASAVTGDANHRPGGIAPNSVMSKLSQLLSNDKGGHIGFVPEFGFVNGGETETSAQTLALRSAAHPYKPNFYYNGQNGMMPRTGQLIVSTMDGRLPAEGNPFYGRIGGVYCSVEPVPHRPNKMLIKALGDGVDQGTTPVKVGSGSASWIRTGHEDFHRGQKHLLWMGRDNVEDTDQVLADTRAAYDVEPATSVVLGQYVAGADRDNTVKRQSVETLNTKLAAAYRTRFFDVQAALRDPSLWKIRELAGYGIGTGARDRDWLAKGLPPHCLFAADERRLNSLGNAVLGHGLARHLTGTAGLYPAEWYKPA